MENDMTKKRSQTAPTPPESMRPIDMPLPEPTRTTINIRKADKGGYVVNHYGHRKGKSYDKTHIAKNKYHLAQVVQDMARLGT